jgi:hypothetical protein
LGVIVVLAPDGGSRRKGHHAGEAANAVLAGPVILLLSALISVVISHSDTTIAPFNRVRRRPSVPSPCTWSIYLAGPDRLAGTTVTFGIACS